MEPRVGSTLASTVDDTTVVVVRWSAGDVEVTCGGAPMVDLSRRAETPRGALDPDHASGTFLGKRYRTEDNSVELLCTKTGEGSLAVAGVPLAGKSAKPLPASD
jgi:hypothetical protein